MFSTKQTVGCEEAARAFRQYPLRTMPNKRRRTEKTAKNKIPLIWQVGIVKIKGKKNFLLLFGHFFTLCLYFNPYVNEGEWSEEKKMWLRKAPKSRSAFSAWATLRWRVYEAHWLESFVALVQVRPFGGIRHKLACSIAPLRCTS